MSETPVKEWNFNPEEILSSPRKVKGIFHQPVVDKDGEIINSKGMREAVPDFMHLPALHDFHKERPVGLATKVQELGGGRFYMEGVIKATHDCDDVWDKVKTGNYGQMSIFGKRTKYNNQCALPQSMRNGPCVTDGVRLDSISICDENARNPQTSLEMMKAKVVFDAEELKKSSPSSPTRTALTTMKHRRSGIDTERGLKNPGDILMGPSSKRREFDDMRVETRKERYTNEEKKAETAGDSILMHSSTDYAGGKVKVKKCPRCKGEDPVTTISKEDEVEKGRTDRIPSRLQAISYHSVNKILSERHGKEMVGTRNQDMTQGMRRADTAHERYSGEDERASAMAGMRNLHKAEGDYGHVGDDTKEEHLPKYKPIKGKSKEVRPPFAETGSEHPKRSKAGYPLTEGGNVPQKPHRPAGAKGEPSKPETEMRERTTSADAVRHYETEAIKKKVAGDTGKKSKSYRIGAPPKAGVKKADAEEVDTMDEEVGKAGKRPSISEEPAKTGGTSQNTRKNVTKEVRRPREEGGYHGGQFEKADDEEMEKGYSKTSHKEHLNDRDKDREHAYAEDRRRDRDMQGDDESELKRGLKKSAAEDLADEDYDEDEDKEFKHAKPSDKEGNWNKSKNPNGTPGLKKAKADDGPDKEEEDEEEEEVEEEEEDVEKAVGYAPNVKPLFREKGPQTISHLKDKPRSESIGTRARQQGKKTTTSRVREEVSEPGKTMRMNPDMSGVRNAQKDMRDERLKGIKKGDEDASSELFDPSTVSKGEQMGYETEQDVEYVTKALVPIEEIDTIVKARTEEISKAYMGRLDEIVKAYDEKVGTLVSRIEKMENETIRKGGSVVVIQELLNSDGTGAQSNADAVAQMQQARR